MESNLFSPSDVRRASDLFEHPVFYSGTAKSAEIVQGEAQDCYLVSALSSMTSVAGLVEGFCVAVSNPVQLFSDVNDLLIWLVFKARRGCWSVWIHLLPRLLLGACDRR